MTKEKKKGYDSTTREPFKPEKSEVEPDENPDKTKKREDNDHTRYTNPDISSIPNNKKNDRKLLPVLISKHG